MHHDRKKYDGYRLTCLGYDYLAIKALTNRGAISGVGRKIGVGKESDVYEVTTDDGQLLALKLHRLGRTSFRQIKNRRDYLQGRTSYNWLYLSRLSALKEFAFMRALGENGFPVPRAVDCNRHCVLMSMVDAFPLTQARNTARRETPRSLRPRAFPCYSLSLPIALYSLRTFCSPQMVPWPCSWPVSACP